MVLVRIFPNSGARQFNQPGMGEGYHAKMPRCHRRPEESIDWGLKKPFATAVNLRRTFTRAPAQLSAKHGVQHGENQRRIVIMAQFTTQYPRGCFFSLHENFIAPLSRRFCRIPHTQTRSKRPIPRCLPLFVRQAP
jgi:hypothetical protein